MDDIDWQIIAAPTDGGAVRFPVLIGATETEGFAIRFGDAFHAYLNSCPHNGSPLDWVPGRFFSEDGKLLICQTHGAMFSPDSGDCLAGPCPRGLVRLPLQAEGDSLQVPSRMDTPDI